MLCALAATAIGCGGAENETATQPSLGLSNYKRALEREADREEQRKIAELRREIAAARQGRRRSLETAPASSTPTAAAVGSLDDLAEELDAQLGATIAPVGSSPQVAGSLQTGSAWSTIKVPIALAVIDRAGGPTGLSSTEVQNIDAALTASDNDAAAALFAGLGDVDTAAGAVTEVLREAGDVETVVSTQGRDTFSPYGQTEWSLAAQHQFMSALLAGSVGSAEAQAFVLERMRMVTSDTWGLGSIGVALWKGGWGPGTDGRYLLRQMGALEIDGQQYVATIAVIPDSGDFAEGQADATALAQWLVEQAP